MKEKKWDEKWSHAENMMLYFQKRKMELNHPSCVLDSKTVVLDENAENLLDVHKYCIEDLKCDTHSFQFLKGSPILGCDYMYTFNDIFEKSSAYEYKKWDAIKEQLYLVKKYNYPVCFNFPIGHGFQNSPVIIGSYITLEVESDFVKMNYL